MNLMLRNRRRQGMAAVALVLGTLLVVGCPASPPTVSGDPAPAGGAAVDEPRPADLVIIEPATLDAMIARHRGKVVIVDFWATWCTNCMELLPHSLELARRHPDDVALITVALDKSSDHAKTLAFLRAQQAAVDNFAVEADSWDDALAAFAIEDNLPHYRFYDRQGTLRTTLTTDPDHLADEENIDAALAALLGGGE